MFFFPHLHISLFGSGSKRTNFHWKTLKTQAYERPSIVSHWQSLKTRLGSETDHQSCFQKGPRVTPLLFFSLAGVTGSDQTSPVHSSDRKISPRLPLRETTDAFLPFYFSPMLISPNTKTLANSRRSNIWISHQGPPRSLLLFLKNNLSSSTFGFLSPNISVFPKKKKKKVTFDL